MRRHFVALAFGILVASIAAAASSEPRHPLSQIHPIDKELNMSDNRIFNVSQLELNDGTISGTGLVFDDFRIRDSGNNYYLRLDTSNTEWEIEGADLNLTGGTLEGVGATECGASEALLGDGSCGATGGGATPNLSEVLASGNEANQTVKFNNNTVSGIGPAQDAFDAVNKSYVDQSDDTVADDQSLGDVLSRGNSSSGTDISVDNANITSDSGNVTFERSIKVYGDVWYKNTTAAGGSSTGSSSGSSGVGNLSEVLTAGNQANQTVDLNGNNVTSTGGNITFAKDLKVYGKIWLPGGAAGGGNGGGSGSQNLSEVLSEGNKAGNSDIDLDGNNLTDTTTGNVSVGDSLRVYGNVWTKGADLAEIYSSPENLEEAEIVSISEDVDDNVERTDEMYAQNAGVVSTNPSHVMNTGEEGYPVALEGKAPVKVTEENGEIRRGDRIVPSSIPGVGMRCETWDPVKKNHKPVREIISHNQKCRDSTVGKALENSEGKDKILVKLE